MCTKWVARYSMNGGTFSISRPFMNYKDLRYCIYTVFRADFIHLEQKTRIVDWEDIFGRYCGYASARSLFLTSLGAGSTAVWGIKLTKIIVTSSLEAKAGLVASGVCVEHRTQYAETQMRCYLLQDLWACSWGQSLPGMRFQVRHVGLHLILINSWA